VLWHDFSLSRKELIKLNHDLHSQEGVQTNDLGEALINLENGAQIRVLPSTELTLEQKTYKENVYLRILLLHGDIQVIKAGNEEAYPLSIGRDGKWVMASAYQDSQVQKSSHSSSDQEVATTSFEAAPHRRTAPSDEEIQISLKRHQNDFFKCYTRLLQIYPEMSGRAQLSFIIPPSGHLDQVSVDLHLQPVGKHPPSDFDEFVRCLKAVTLRQEFKPFSGPTIAAQFPLQFD